MYVDFGAGVFQQVSSLLLVCEVTIHNKKTILKGL
jgi:hypothetical protein